MCCNRKTYFKHDQYSSHIVRSTACVGIAACYCDDLFASQVASQATFHGSIEAHIFSIHLQSKGKPRTHIDFLWPDCSIRLCNYEAAFERTTGTLRTQVPAVSLIMCNQYIYLFYCNHQEDLEDLPLDNVHVYVHDGNTIRCQKAEKGECCEEVTKHRIKGYGTCPICGTLIWARNLTTRPNGVRQYEGLRSTKLEPAERYVKESGKSSTYSVNGPRNPNGKSWCVPHVQDDHSGLRPAIEWWPRTERKYGELLPDFHSHPFPRALEEPSHEYLEVLNKSREPSVDRYQQLGPHSRFTTRDISARRACTLESSRSRSRTDHPSVSEVLRPESNSDFAALEREESRGRTANRNTTIRASRRADTPRPTSVPQFQVPSKEVHRFLYSLPIDESLIPSLICPSQSRSGARSRAQRPAR